MSETLEIMIAKDRAAAIAWAREVLEDKRTVILDTETTGLYPPVDFVEIGVVDTKGRQLFHSLVRPHCPLTREATRIHGYTMDDLDGMPEFHLLFPALCEFLYPRRIVVYNAAYERMVFDYSASRFSGFARRLSAMESWECAMTKYAEYAGDWNEKKRSYRWKRLDGGDHTAIGDCKATLAVVREMAEEL